MLASALAREAERDKSRGEALRAESVAYGDVLARRYPPIPSFNISSSARCGLLTVTETAAGTSGSPHYGPPEARHSPSRPSGRRDDGLPLHLRSDRRHVGGTLIGPSALAAVSTAGFFMWILLNLGEMVEVGLIAVAARRHGEGFPERRLVPRVRRSCMAWRRESW